VHVHRHDGRRFTSGTFGRPAAKTRHGARETANLVDNHAASHLSAALIDHIGVYGNDTFDIEPELQPSGHRPLRSPGEPR
jgi:hypothetical protein